MNSKHKVIVESTGTEYGMSIISNIAWGCARAEWFKLKAQQETPETQEIEGYKYVSEGLLTGSIGHAILDAYYQGYELDDLEIETPDVSPDMAIKCKQKALYACNGYAVLHPRNEFGKVLELEKAYETTLFGLPYSFRPDMVVKIGARESKKLLESRRVDVEPGLWLVDHKFLASVNGNMIEWYINGFSGPSYTMAWNACHPKKEQVQGMIFNFISKAKETRVVTYAQYAGDNLQTKILELTFNQAREKGFPLDPNDPMPAPNPSCCFHQFYGACSWYSNGSCPRF